VKVFREYGGEGEGGEAEAAVVGCNEGIFAGSARVDGDVGFSDADRRGD
jgi:hypothetical protein